MSSFIFYIINCYLVPVNGSFNPMEKVNIDNLLLEHSYSCELCHKKIIYKYIDGEIERYESFKVQEDGHEGMIKPCDQCESLTPQMRPWSVTLKRHANKETMRPTT